MPLLFFPSDDVPPSNMSSTESLIPNNPDSMGQSELTMASRAVTSRRSSRVRSQNASKPRYVLSSSSTSTTAWSSETETALSASVSTAFCPLFEPPRIRLACRTTIPVMCTTCPIWHDSARSSCSTTVTAFLLLLISVSQCSWTWISW